MHTYYNEKMCLKVDTWNSWWNVLLSNTDFFYSFFIFSNSAKFFSNSLTENLGKVITYWYIGQEECADAISFPEII